MVPIQKVRKLILKAAFPITLQRALILAQFLRIYRIFFIDMIQQCSANASLGTMRYLNLLSNLVYSLKINLISYALIVLELEFNIM